MFIGALFLGMIAGILHYRLFLFKNKDHKKESLIIVIFTYLTIAIISFIISSKLSWVAMIFAIIAGIIIAALILALILRFISSKPEK